MVYTLTVNPAIDYILTVEDFVIGKVNRTTCENVYYGGKGINVSRVLNELDIDNIALGFVAGFTGEQFETQVNLLGVKTELIKLKTGMTRINVKLKSKQETEINTNGPEVEKTSLNKLLNRISKLESEDYLCLCGSVSKSMPVNFYEQVIKCVEAKGVRVVVDTTGNQLVNTLKYKPFLIKPNTHELGEIFNVKINTEDEIIQYAENLKHMGACNVLVSMAGDGALLLCENGKVYKQKPPQGIVKNSVGAGDSMIAGFLAGYIKTADFAKALHYGVSAGSATAFSDDLCTIKEINKLI